MTLLEMAIPIIGQLIFLLLVKEFLPFEEGSFNLMLIITTGGISTVIGLITLILTSKYYNEIIYNYKTNFLKNN